MATKKPKILVVANNKGGVGKSLVSQLISTYVALKKNKKVLVLDFDPQGNMSYRFLRDTRIRDISNYKPPLHPDYDPSDPDDAEWSGRSSATDLWSDNPVIPYPTEIANLDILPSDALAIRDIETIQAHEQLEEIIQAPYDFFNMPEFIDCGYDLVLIDTPPAKGPVTQSAIRAATHVLLPLELSNKSLQGLAGMVDLINRENIHRPADQQTQIVGLLKNKLDYKKRTPQNRVLDSIRANPLLNKLLIEELNLHDSPRAIDIDEDRAPISAPYTDLRSSDRFAIEASQIGEYIYKNVLKEKAHAKQKENNLEVASN